MNIKFNVREELFNILITAMTLVTSLAINEAIKDTINLIPTGKYKVLSKWTYATIVISILITILVIKSYVYCFFLEKIVDNTE